MSPNNPPPADAYAAAGVDIAAGDAFVRRIAPAAARTHGALAAQGAALLAGVGAFAAAVSLPRLQSPVLLTAADGVGSKLELARAHNAPKVIGHDVVAMCINDLLCAGARPLLFLDYYACHTLTADFAAAVVEGIADACVQGGCALVGGETAEMPATYARGRFDVAGFAAGIADESELLRPADARAGDALIAVASSGAHSNGYALVHRILAENADLPARVIDGDTIINHLLRPTKLYVNAVAALRAAVRPRALAHITGGGLAANMARVVPADLRADYSLPALPPLFEALRAAGGLREEEMRRVFNCGIGMVAVVAAADADAALAALAAAGESAWRLGVLRAR